MPTLKRVSSRPAASSAGWSNQRGAVILEGATIFALVVVAFVVITALMGVRQVPQGYNYTVERFGRYYKTLTPGLGLIVPYIDAVGRKLNVMEQVMDVPEPGNHHQG